jgi:hypothetical protein
MAQRSLGRLPAVQPLATPQYAGMREEPREAAATPGLAEETETMAPVRAQESAVGRRPVEAGEGEAQESKPASRSEERGAERRLGNVETHGVAAPVSAPVLTGERRVLAKQSDGQPGIERGRRVEARQFAAEAVDKKIEPAEDGKPSTAAAERTRDWPRVERLEPRTADAKSERREGSGREGSSVESVPAEKIAPWRPGIVQNDSAEIAKQIRPVAELAQGIERRGGPQREPRAATPAEEKTEIQITIGSIELRAPRVETRSEPRPARPPFRPRVTLDEFLRRQERRP